MPARTEVFVDTSAWFALLVKDDFTAAARRAVESIADSGAALVTSSLVLQESIALMQARVGIAPVRALNEEWFPLVDVVWIGADTFRRALSALLAAARRQVSLTDWTSFEVMRQRGIRRAFAFDDHFRQQGFELVAVADSG